jgi:hypothetical protein
MKANVITLLKTTPEEYEAFLIDFYFEWCQQKSNNKKSLQKLLTCPPLFNWWLRELENLEKLFVDDCQLYKSTITKQDALTLYKINTVHLHNIFCKPLIKMAHDS